MGSWACFFVPMNRIVPAAGDEVADEAVGLLDQPEGLLQVDDVDAVALAEDEPLHLRVPATGLVPEVHPRLEQLPHGDDGRHRGSLSFSAVGLAPLPYAPRGDRGRAGALLVVEADPEVADGAA